MSDASPIDYSQRIPNNVDLGGDRRLQRALEAWQPDYIQWWREMGPDGSLDYDVFLRTAVSVDPKGWAHFDYVKMPDYRWGIFLTPSAPDRRVNFGTHKGLPAWQEVPGEYRGLLRRLIVVQGDTEPASVEQQRRLGMTAPSLYDMRNLFQVNVEEGRHLWAMVYLLHAYFGRDGREEADEMLRRRSGNADKPRILGAFNEPTPDWLSFYFFTMFTDRDGKFQLYSLAESGFDPLARTCRFMLTEEAHHMFVGESGISRILQRTGEVMATVAGDPRHQGVIDFPTMQRYLNFHYSVTLDLYGSEVSTNAANAFVAGLKGRYQEEKIDDDHQLAAGSYPVLTPDGTDLRWQEVPALNALNERLRDDFIRDCEAGVERWNRVIRKTGSEFELKLPHRGFNRRIGHFSTLRIAPDGRVLTEAEWQDRVAEWLPTESDRQYVTSLMQRGIRRPGQFAHWIAAPQVGIGGKPVDFEYVRLD